MERYMSRCLELASSAEGLTAPNPMVGAVLVCDNRIVAEGKHACYGALHAEPDAINKINNRELLAKCTLYVNLEPCCHHGKTPPCTEKIIAAGIPRVVVAALDISDKVNGKGIRILNEAGVETEMGVLEKEAIQLNRFFYTFHAKKRPYILLKWAQTSDGYLDSDRQNAAIPPTRISNSLTQILDHHWRSEYQAIMVGTNTIIMDDPQLTVRKWYGNNPLRITIDRRGRLNGNCNFFNNSAPSLLFTAQPAVDFGKNTTVVHSGGDLQSVVNELYSRKIQSLIIEGGTQLIESFIALDLWDEARIFTGNFNLYKGVKAPAISGKIVAKENLGTNTVTTIVK
jgi:diaminohydroxyphosphoribosylaminopyrimidine deaminase/5-amino-6-(5-phosphoribosylamino)uracil reductase